MKWIIFLFFLILLTKRESSAYSPEKARFTVRARESVSSYRINSLFLLPKENIFIEVMEGKGETPYNLRVLSGKVREVTSDYWYWQAPGKKGLYPLIIFHPEGLDSILFNIYVMVPSKRMKGESLNGYQIGQYPAKQWKNLSIYTPPQGFIEVTLANEENFLSPHFQLKQFLCKQEGGYPKYIVLRENLLLKLEMILEKVNEKGFPCETFNILSGYRTPYYNRSLGNVLFSRHPWGDAADFFIDEDPRDNWMDDLNGDGEMNDRDGDVLYEIIEELDGEDSFKPFVGGLGRYRKNSFHGPFIHVDVRGFHARMGS